MAFNGTTGHTHDGTTGEGANIVLTTSVTGTLPLANGGLAATTAAGGRTTLEVVPGTDVQAFDAGLLSIAGLTTLADRMIYTTASDTYAVATLTTAGRALIDDASATAQRTTLGLGSLATASTINNGDWSGTDLAIANGGTGSSTASTARTALGLGTLAVENTAPVAQGGTGATTASGARTNLGVVTATTSAEGLSEWATIAETTTGTAADRVITPDGLAGSDFGIRTMSFNTSVATDTVTGNAQAFLVVPAELNGWKFVDALGYFSGTIATGAATNVQINNGTNDMFSTALTIDAAERASTTAAIPFVIDTNYDDMSTDDVLQIDIDAIGSTLAGTGLNVILYFQKV